MEDTQKNILRLERELNVKNPHRAAEIAVEMSVLLGNYSDYLSDLEDDYAELKLSAQKQEITRAKRFLKTRESTVKRIEHFLKNITTLESRGA